MNHKLILILTALGLVAIMSGCTSLQTFPTVARAGDTVSVAVGAPDGMTRANTTVYFEYDSDSSQVNLTPGIRSIFKLHADPVSGMHKKVVGQPSSVDIPSLIQTSGHAPWVTVMVVDLPSGMTAGTGQLLVNTTGADYPTIGSHINDLQTNGKRIDLVPTCSHRDSNRLDANELPGIRSEVRVEHPSKHIFCQWGAASVVSADKED